MQIDNHKSKVLEFLRKGKAALRRIEDKRADSIAELLKETQSKESPAILFYGMYNAGKSTLINALCGKLVAKVGDVPTTAKVDYIPWEGYTLIDTPGINAKTEHTRIAEAAIQKSDIVLFVIDSTDTFDNRLIYQKMLKILHAGRALAIVLNQKNSSEDPNIPVPDQQSTQTLMAHIAANLERENSASGGKGVYTKSNFLGIFPVNSKLAFEALNYDAKAAAYVMSCSGLNSLVNAINQTVQRIGRVRMLVSPLIALSELLGKAVEDYRSAEVYGEQQQLARDREQLALSRNRMHDLLLAKGLLKIEAAFEQVKTATAAGQSVDGVMEQLNKDLQLLLEETAMQEHGILNEKIQIKNIPMYQHIDNGAAPLNESESDLQIVPTMDKSTLQAFTQILHPIPELEIPFILVILQGIKDFFLRKAKEEREARERARRSAEQLAAYYKRLNELRDYEASVKASYEKSVEDFLTQHYDRPLGELEKILASVNSTCEEHTENLRTLEMLQHQVGKEMAVLSVSA